MNEVDIAAWVAQAPPGQKGFREAVHITLDAIGRSKNLQAKMIMKGGLLMAIRYDSSRFTRDLDFSTTGKYTKLESDELLKELDQQLAVAAEHLSYGTVCAVQASEVQPKGEDKSHHSLSLKIGYADSGNAAGMRRLRAKQSPHVVEVDYSYNEAVFDVEVVQLDGGVTIQAYSLHNVIAEKLRSLLQQPVRKRNRRQDVYDICLLLDSADTKSAENRASIHRMMVESCRSKDIEPDPKSMDDEAVVAWARKGYDELKADVDGELAPFDESMAKVQALYRSLPWTGGDAA